MRLHIKALFFHLFELSVLSTLLGFYIVVKNTGYAPSPAGESDVYIAKVKDSYRFVKNGEPLLINGFSGKPVALELLKELGANTLRVYDPEDYTTAFEKSEILGIHIIADIPIPNYAENREFYASKSTRDSLYDNIIETVNHFKNEPALLSWNLGNEIGYPFTPGHSEFIAFFNRILDGIHDADPNHPVSTALLGIYTPQIINLNLNSPQLDYISFNSFGSLLEDSSDFNDLKIFYDGPYLITEWGNNGYWEERETSWSGPIEQTSTKKAESISDRYETIILPLQETNCMGSCLFYWGQKEERTPTWFSILSSSGDLSQTGVSISQFWMDEPIKRKVPELQYLLLNNKGAADNILLKKAQTNQAELVYKEDLNIEFEWEIRKENWYYIDKRGLSENLIDSLILKKDRNLLEFKAPSEAGPYRLYVFIRNGQSGFATTNIPFYVID